MSYQYGLCLVLSLNSGENSFEAGMKSFKAFTASMNSAKFCLPCAILAFLSFCLFSSTACFSIFNSLSSLFSFESSLKSISIFCTFSFAFKARLNSSLSSTTSMPILRNSTISICFAVFSILFSSAILFSFPLQFIVLQSI